ncbi:MAG: type VII secretion-associated protein [Mycobacteriaceae bacterium]
MIDLSGPAVSARSGSGTVVVSDIARKDENTLLIGQSLGGVHTISCEDVLGHIDEPVILIGDHPWLVVDVLGEICRRVVGLGMAGRKDPLYIVHPTYWGLPRQAVLARAARKVTNNVVLVPRAVAAMRSLGRTAAGRVGVWEERGSSAFFSVLDRTEKDWRILHTEPVDVIAVANGGQTEALVSVVERLNSSARLSFRAVFVVTDEAKIAEVLPKLGERLPPLEELAVIETAFLLDCAEPVQGSVEGLVAQASRTVTGEPGGTSLPVSSIPGSTWQSAASWVAPSSRSASWGIWAALSLVMVLVVGAVVWLVFVRQSTTEDGVATAKSSVISGQVSSSVSGSSSVQSAIAEPVRVYRQGRVSFEVPQSWIEEQSAPQASGTPRTIFTKPSNPGIKLNYNVNELAPGVTLDVVVAGLAKEMEERQQEGVFSNLKSGFQFGHRTVAGYRERRPTSGTTNWYVIVEGGFRINIGCQTPLGHEGDIKNECEQAIRTAVVS